MAVTNPTSIAPYITGTAQQSLVRVVGRIQASGTTPNFQIPAGLFSSPTHTSGVYSVVVNNFAKLGTLVSAQLSVLNTTSSMATTGVLAIPTTYVASTGVLTFETWDLAATPAKVAVTDDEWICFDLVFAQDVLAEGTAGALA